ncbi:retrovirus-related pol polyprotein from transposon TNT 1-94 [Tanacetum coccineum]
MGSNEETNAAGTDTRPPMLVESDYDSWKIRIHRYIRGKPNGKLIWKSIQNGPTPHPMITDPPPTDSTIVPAPREKLDSEFSEEENKLEMADTQAEIILSQGLPRHIFNNLNQTSTAKEIWDNVEMLMQGSGRTIQQRKEDLFDEYERFRAIGNESIHDYFVRFHKLVNDMKITQLNIPTHQMNTKFVNNLPAYWDANLLSGFPKAVFHPPTTTLRTSSNSRTHATVHDGTELLLNQFRGGSRHWTKITCFNAHHEDAMTQTCMKAPICVRFHGQLVHHTNQPINPVTEYLLDTEAQNVPTEVSADTSDKVSMIAILTDLQTQLDGHAKKELSGDQAYWLFANEIASQDCKPATPATPFVHKSQPPSQVLASLQKVNAVFHQFEGSTEGSCDQQALETDRIQLQDTITSLRIQLDGLKVENRSEKTTKRFKRQPKKEWKPIKRVWKPISKPVANSKPQWKPTGRHFSLFEKQVPKGSLVVQIVLWYLDSGCSRHMTGDRARLINFVEKFIGTVRFGNDEYAAIVGYGDYKLGDTIISRVYYVEGLKHNLFFFSRISFVKEFRSCIPKAHSVISATTMVESTSIGSRTTTFTLFSLKMNDQLQRSFFLPAHKSLFHEVMASRPTSICCLYVVHDTRVLSLLNALTAIKRIFRYLKGTINMGLWYPKDSGFELKAFADADYAGCHDTRRSTSGSAQFLGHRLVSWSSKKQKSTAISTTEAEYIALSWMQSQIPSGMRILTTIHWICHIDIRHQNSSKSRHYPERALRTLLPLLGVKQMSPDTLKELQDESVSELKKGRVLLLSLNAERLNMTTASKFKRQIAVSFPVRVLNICPMIERTCEGEHNVNMKQKCQVILWNAEERDVVPPGGTSLSRAGKPVKKVLLMNLSDHKCSIHTVIIDPYESRVANDNSKNPMQDMLRSLTHISEEIKKFTYKASAHLFKINVSSSSKLNVMEIEKGNTSSKLPVPTYMSMINPSKTSRVDNVMPNKPIKASIRIKLITTSQPHVISHENVNSNSNCISFTGVESTAKTRRPQPKSNTKNDRVPSASKRSLSKFCYVAYTRVVPSIYWESPKLLINFNLEVIWELFSLGNDHNCCIFYRFKVAFRRKVLSKDEAPEVIKTFLKKIQVLLQAPFIIVRTENNIEFKNQVLKEYFDSVGISYKSSSVRTPWQNGVMKQTNQTLVEAARTLKLDISFLHVFGDLCYPKNDSEDIGKLGAKGDIGFFIGYSANSCFDLTYAPSIITSKKPTERELDLLFEAMYDDYIGGQPSAAPRIDPTALAPQWTKDHPIEQVIGEPSRPVLTCNQLRTDGDMYFYVLTPSTVEPRNIKEAMTDPAWIDSMQEELLQFKRLDVWVLVPTPDNIKPLTLKWLLKNKHDEENTVIRNKTRLVVRGYRQE